MMSIIDDSIRIIELEKKEMELSSVCNYICSNYIKIHEEIFNIMYKLRNAEDAAIAYADQKNFLKMHIEKYFDDTPICWFFHMVDKLEEVKQGAKEELFRGVDFFHIEDEVLRRAAGSEVISFIWKAQKILQNISYQLERISDAKDEKKQVAILKGIIAYY